LASLSVVRRSRQNTETGAGTSSPPKQYEPSNNPGTNHFESDRHSDKRRQASRNLVMMLLLTTSSTRLHPSATGAVI
jgi:hypothetical protein